MSRQQHKNIIIITGASSGIGMEFALQTDGGFSNIDEFWLIARNRGRLSEVAKALRHKSRIFAMDITEPEQIQTLADVAEGQHAVVRMLINAAGYGLMGNFERQETEGTLGMIRVNCEALTAMTHAMLPYMRKGSRIIQVASSAAFLPQSDFAVYAATKSYVLSFSRALGEELREREIFVTAVCPGPVDTPFFDIAERNGSTLKIKKHTMVSPERVVALALKDSFRKKSLSVCSLPIKSYQLASKYLPNDMMFGIMRILQRLEDAE